MHRKELATGSGMQKGVCLSVQIPVHQSSPESRFYTYPVNCKLGCQGLELVLIRTIPHSLIMDTNTRVLIILLGILSWMPQLVTKSLCLRLCTLAGSRHPCDIWPRPAICGSLIRGVADTSTESRGVRVQILGMFHTRGQIWAVKDLELQFVGGTA